MKDERYKHMDYRMVEFFAAMRGEPVGRLEQQWRKEIESKPLPLNTTLQAALNKLPAPWIDGICLSLSVPAERKRRDKVTRIIPHLNNQATLQKTITGLSGDCKEALAYILDCGGWVKYGELSRRFGDDEGDGWWWDKKPPQTVVGQLRLRGLVFVGKTPVGGRLYKVAMIPQELRQLLADALGASKPVELAKKSAKAHSGKFYRILGARLGELKFDFATFATEEEATWKYYRRFMSYFEKAAYPGHQNAEGFAKEEYFWNLRLPGSDKFLIDYFLESYGEQIPDKLKEGMLNWRGAELRYYRILGAKDLLLLEDPDTGEKVRCLCLNLGGAKVFRKWVGHAVIGYVSPWDEDTHCLMGFSAVVPITQSTKAVYQDLKQTLREVTAKTQKYFARLAKKVRAEPSEVPEVFRKAFQE